MKPAKLRPMVETILREYPPSRDSDQWLTVKLWTVFYPEYIINYKENGGTTLETNKKAVVLQDIMKLPREDNIKRLRAKIQNEEKKYLPTTLAIALKRRINESEWRNYCRTN